MVATQLELVEGVEGLVTYASEDLDALWREFDAAQASEALHDVLPALIATYGLAASALAADWYDELRAQVGPRARFTAIPAEIRDVGAHALVGWALDTATDDTTLKSLILGGTQRRIANHSRETVTRSSLADPGARGWKRVGVGHSCEFCRMLLGRDAVYTSATVTFEAHDNCNCGAAPEWA